MTLRELIDSTDEEVVVYRTTPWDNNKELVNIPTEKEGDYIVNKLWIEDNKIVADVTHLTYLII